LLSQFASIGLYLVVAVLFASLLVLIPLFLKLGGLVTKKPTAVKNSTFECGMETIGNTLVRFNFRYYFFALLFVIFDVLVLFLYPWAVGLRQSGLFGLVAILVFMFLISIGYLFAWKKKVLEWK
jgi:NADH-quinone oxidoreductase subunit A